MSLQLLQRCFDDLFYPGVGVFLQNRRHDFVDVGLGETEHHEGRGGLVDEGVRIGLEDGRGLGAGALDDLVLELFNYYLIRYKINNTISPIVTIIINQKRRV
jgi:hypothetical protein